MKGTTVTFLLSCGGKEIARARVSEDLKLGHLSPVQGKVITEAQTHGLGCAQEGWQ